MELTILILLLPFFSFLILGIGGKMDVPPDSGYNRYADTGSSSSTILRYSYPIFLRSTTGRRNIRHTDALQLHVASFLQRLYTSIWGILLDPISVMMLIVISTVSLMVHIYSFGYMKGEVGFQRYYAFLSLFTMSMLGLVVATNIFQMYLFWELVGGKFLPANRFLLYKTGCHCCFQESVYCYSLC